MKRLTAPLLFIILAIISYLLPSCDGMDDNYSTNPNLRLSFSKDTLSFDTVFTTIGSATRQFMIYNKNKEPLNMETVMLASGGSSGFRINVDGQKGTLFNNIGILKQDSMHVFVEVTVNPNNTNQPLLLQDSIVFSVNGILQSVILEAYGQDVHLYKGGVTVEKNTTLTSDKPYLLYDSLVIAPNTTLTVDKGVTFYMHDKANLVVYGTLKTAGTLDAPVTFRGDRLDFILNDLLPYDRTPGQWGGIYFKSESFDNQMDYTIVRNATNGLTFLESTPDRLKMSITNSQLTNSRINLLSAINCSINFTNSELTNAVGVAVGLVGGKYQFTHCTLANHMRLIPDNSLKRLCLLLANKPEYGLNATFINSIIDGGSNDELSLLEADGSNFNYTFDHCIVKATIKNNENFINSQIIGWSPDYYLNGGDKNKYKYDFRLVADTVVGVGKADPIVTQKYPFDRLGVNRLTSSNGPTIGAYEYVKLEEEDDK